MKKQYKCCVPGCDRIAKVYKHRLCASHLQRYYRNGTTKDHRGRSEIIPKLKDKIKKYRPSAEKVMKYKQHNPYEVK